MTAHGTVAEILRAPAIDWPAEIAREANQGRREAGAPPHPANTMDHTTTNRERVTPGRAA